MIRSVRISKVLSATFLGETIIRSSTYGKILRLCLPIMWAMAMAIIWNAYVSLAHPNAITGSIYHWHAHVMPTLTASTGAALRLRKSCAMSILQSAESLGMLRSSCTMSSIFWKSQCEWSMVKNIPGNLNIYRSPNRV